MIEISALAPNLKLDDDGIWISKLTSDISYPHDANNAIFEIEDHSFWFRHRNRCVIEAIRAFAPDGPVFDVGGGNGFISYALQNEGIETVLVEPGRQGVDNARKRGIKQIIGTTLEQAGFLQNVIPSIGIFDVLEHVEDDLEFLLKIKAYLIPDGLLYITVPAYNLLWSYEDVDAGHFRRYTLGELVTRLQKAGYHVEYASYFFKWLPIPIFLFRTLPDKLSLVKRRQEYGVKDHAQPNQAVRKVLNYLLDSETDMIRQKKTIDFGGSCLIVARSA